MPDPETASTEVPLRRRKRVRLIVLLALLAAVWFAHPYVLDWGIRKVLPLALAPAGLEIEIGKIRANFARPFHFENVVLKVVRPKASRTRIEVGTLDASLNWPWQIVFGEGRFFRKAVAQDWSVYADTRKVAMPTDPMPQFTPDQEQNIAAMVLRALPQDIDLQDGSVKVMGDDQSFEFDRVSATFSENALGILTSRNSVIHLGKGVHRFAELKGVTAWKNGTAYAADVTLRPDIRIDSYHIDLARPGGLSMEFVADLFGGSLRGGLTLGAEKGLPKIDGALWVSNIGLASFPALAGEKTDIGGTVREARFTFRGNPDRPLEAEAALWAVADGVQWNKRGWESLELGANLIHQRLTVSNFNLRQKMNRLGGNGEVSLAGGWESLSDAPFLANMTGDIQDLGALAGLIGAPFDEMTGRMSLNGSVSGSAGKLDGFLSVEGSQIGYREHPIESAKIDIRFAGEEAQIERCEIWSGDDYLRAQGSMGLKKPFHYGGELQARALDLAQYATLFRAPGAESVYSGSLQLRWQGDGTLSANSGAFTLSVDDFVSEFTPSGLTGRFSATYSPENLYFSNLELAHDGMLFSTRATAAKDGLTLKNAVLRSGKGSRRRRGVPADQHFRPGQRDVMGQGAQYRKAILRQHRHAGCSRSGRPLRPRRAGASRGRKNPGQPHRQRLRARATACRQGRRARDHSQVRRERRAARQPESRPVVEGRPGMGAGQARDEGLRSRHSPGQHTVRIHEGKRRRPQMAESRRRCRGPARSASHGPSRVPAHVPADSRNRRSALGQHHARRKIPGALAHRHARTEGCMVPGQSASASYFQRQRRREFRCPAGRHLTGHRRDRRWTGDILGLGEFRHPVQSQIRPHRARRKSCSAAIPRCGCGQMSISRPRATMAAEASPEA